LAGCGEAPGGSLTARDAVPVAEDASTAHDAAPADAGPAFTPDAPADGDAELSIFGAQDPDAPFSVSEVAQGATLHGQFGMACIPCAHVFAGFELRSQELSDLDEAERRQLETTTSLELRRLDGTVIATNENLSFALSFEVPGRVRSVPIQLVLDRGNTPLPGSDELLTYRVSVSIPGGSTYTRQAWVRVEWSEF
jgi:hypothetical protein